MTDSRMKKYEAYKDTCIQWIGEIPEGWFIVPLKHYLSLKGRIGWNGLKSDEFQEKSYAYLVTGQDFNSDVVNWNKCYQISKERYDEDPFIQLENGDILVTKDGTIGKVAKVLGLDKPACLNSGIFVVKQTKDVFVQNYLYWLLVSNQLKEFVGYNSTGTTIAHLYQNVFENMPLIVPSFSEQQIIADYLDHKVGQIDASIFAINAQIDDLKAYRMSVISEAVTKGLNPDAPMKDSGLGWIGAIPEGWKILKMNFILSGLQDGTHGTFDRVDNGYPLLSAKNVFPSGIVFEEKESYISESDFKTIVSNGFPQKGDVALCCVGTVGRCCVYTYDYPMAFQRSVTFLRPNNKVLSYYLWYYLQSNKFQDQLGKYAKTSAQSGVYLGDIAKTIVILPPLSEQQAIATYLDHKTSKIDAAIASLESQRDDLNALKQSVISEAVTGKIDVRGWKLNIEQ